MKACYRSKSLHQMTDEERLKLQSHLRKMYLEIEKVCDRHGLKMTTGYGTVLGALRHKGFIPWDDDIDLLMPREDYDRLINEYADELPRQYKIYAPNSKNGPIYRFAKVVDTSTRLLGLGDKDSEKKGIFVDIFPLENAYTRKFEITKQNIEACFLMYIATSVDGYQGRGNNAYKKVMCSSFAGAFNYYFRKFIGLVFSWWSGKKWYNVFDKVMTNNPNTGFYNVPSAGPKSMWFAPLPAEMFFPAKKVEFDDVFVYVPNWAEKHLEYEYGDWMQIPPENERWLHFINEIRFSV